MSKSLLKTARKFLIFISLLGLLFSFFNLSFKPTIAFSPVADQSSPIKILKVTLQSLEEGVQKQTIIEGTAPANSQIVIFIQRAGEKPLEKTAKADVQGHWQVTLDYSLPVGSYQLWATSPAVGGEPISETGKSQLVVFLPSVVNLVFLTKLVILAFPLFLLGFLRLKRKEIFFPHFFRSLSARGPPLLNTRWASWLLLALLSLATFITNLFIFPEQTFASINQKLNYQGKLTDGNYDAVSDGAYHMEYKLYTQASGGSAIWTETWDNSYTFSALVFGQVASGGTSIVYDTDTKEGTLAVGQYLTNTTDSDYVLITAVNTTTNTLTVTATNKIWSDNANIHNRTRVVNGVFSVELGNVDGFSTGDYYDLSDEQVTAAQWNGELYLTVNVGGSGATPSWDGEMSPRRPIASVPYAFNAMRVAGLTVTDTTGTLTIPDATTITFSGANDLTLTTTAVTNATLPSGTITLADLASSQTLTNKTIGSTGLTFSGATTDITTVATEDLTLTAGTTGDVVVSADADTNFRIVAAAAPGVNLAEITNAGQGATTASVDGLSINYVQATDATDITGSGLDIAVTPSGDAGDTIRGINIDNITGTASTEYALVIGTGWDRGLDISSPAQIGSTLTTTGTTVIGSGGNTFTFNPASGLEYAGTARPSKVIVLSPEYDGASLTADGSSTTNGSMTSDNAGSGTAWRNYYQWSSTQAALQDYTVMVRVSLPQDFDTWETGSCPGTTCALEIYYQTGVAGTTNNYFSAIINNDTDTPGTAVCTISSLSSTTWTSTGCTEATLNDGVAPEWDAAGETAVIRLKLAANSTASALARVGDIILRYKAKF